MLWFQINFIMLVLCPIWIRINVWTLRMCENQGSWDYFLLDSCSLLHAAGKNAIYDTNNTLQTLLNWHSNINMKSMKTNEKSQYFIAPTHTRTDMKTYIERRYLYYFRGKSNLQYLINSRFVLQHQNLIWLKYCHLHYAIGFKKYDEPELKHWKMIAIQSRKSKAKNYVMYMPIPCHLKHWSASNATHRLMSKQRNN